MQQIGKKADSAKSVASLIDEAGGRVVGRTRLQKMVYLLEIAGLGEGFTFDYHHYGPYSEELADASNEAVAKELVKETEAQTSWGGVYSTFSTTPSVCNPATIKGKLIQIAQDANPVALELAATAVYLAHDGFGDPWEETAQRKPNKARARIEDAKRLYLTFQSLQTPNPFPKLIAK